MLAKYGLASSHASRILQTDCFNEVPLQDGFSLKYRLDEDENSNTYMTAQLHYEGTSWIGFGITGEIPGMIGSQAVLGLPDDASAPALWFLGDKNENAIVPLEDNLQTLFDQSVEQDGTSTTLTFSKYLEEPGHNPIKVGEDMFFIYAAGFGNQFGFHEKKNFFSLSLTAQCGTDVEEVEEEEIPVEEDDGLGLEDDGTCWNKVPVQDGFDFRYRIEEDQDNRLFIAANMRHEGRAWLAVGITGENPGMVGSQAVIGLLGEEEEEAVPVFYALNEKGPAGVVPLEDDLQTLFNHSVAQNEAFTTLKFSKYLEEPGHNPIKLNEETFFLLAAGFSNDLQYHQLRGVFGFIPVQGCADGEATSINFEDPAKRFWKAHGILAATGWGIATPIAILSSVFRDMFKVEGRWFMVHRTLNLLTFVLTVAAVTLAFVLFRTSGQTHFTKAHHVIGMIVFILACVQVVGGILRPHVGEPKTHKRIKWEYFHKTSGVLILILSIYQIFTGLNYYVLYYSVWNWSPVYIAWIVALVLLTFAFKMKVRLNEKQS